VRQSSACLVKALHLLIALTAAASAPAAAQEEDLQQWTLLSTTGQLSGKVTLYAEVQPRFTDDVGRIGQLLLRPAIGYRVAPDLSVFLGYAYVRTDPKGGRSTDEHRLFQQLSFTAYRGPGGFTITGRTRLEQRTVIGSDELGWRFRQVIRAERKISRSGMKAVAWTEPFVNLDTTDWGQRGGVDQWRTFLGVGLPVSASLTVDAGYLNQTVFRRGQDRVNHALGLTFAHRF
jgi:hypothetical protein